MFVIKCIVKILGGISYEFKVMSFGDFVYMVIICWLIKEIDCDDCYRV